MIIVRLGGLVAILQPGLHSSVINVDFLLRSALLETKLERRPSKIDRQDRIMGA